MRILGIDPGTQKVGFGVIDVEGDRFSTVTYGVIQTDSKAAMPSRLAVIYRDIQELLNEVKPDQVAIEQLFAFRNVTNVITVSQARGVLVLAVEQQGLPISEYTPMVVKQSLTGYGRAEKREVQEQVKEFLNLDKIPRPDDAADALAIAICHVQHQAGGLL
jgi:crossover junction endodeoxyribonuclease RuvC